MKLGDFITTLAKKCNMEDDGALISLLSNAELAQRDISDSFANALDTQLMSFEGAKNNDKVLNHFKPIILKAVDEKFSILADKYGFADEATAEKSTYKKFDILESKLESKIADLESKQGKSGDPDKEKKLTDDLKLLQKQMGQLADQKQNELDALTKQHSGQMTEMLVKFNLSGKKFANKDLPIEVNTTVAKTLIENKLKEKGAILVNEDGVLKLKQAANPIMDFVDSGSKVISFSDFTDQTLAESKLLEVSGAPAQNPTPQGVPAPARIPAGGTQINTSSFDAAMQSATEDIKTT